VEGPEITEIVIFSVTNFIAWENYLHSQWNRLILHHEYILRGMTFVCFVFDSVAAAVVVDEVPLKL